MLNLKAEIFTIIKQQDFIILPMLGAFQANYTKPYINSDGEIVESVRKQVFIPQFKKDLDNKLLNILVSKSSLPISLISSELENFIAEINNSIMREKHFTWTNLGLFFYNDNKEIEFIESIANKEDVKSIIANPLGQESQKSDIEFAQNVIIPPDEIEVNTEIDSQSSRINYYKLALYVIPFLLLISGLIWTVFLKPNDKITLKRGILTEIDSLEIAKQQLENQEITETIPENTVIEKTVKPKEIKEDTAKSVIVKIPGKEEQLTTTNNKNLKITIGTYKSRENLDNFTTYLAENGIPAKIRKERNYYMVYVNAINREQAERFSAKILDLTGEQPIINN